MTTLAAHFMEQHRNPPGPFNPNYNPNWKEIQKRVTSSMEADGFYDNHTREECSAEYRRRWDEIKSELTVAT